MDFAALALRSPVSAEADLFLHPTSSTQQHSAATSQEANLWRVIIVSFLGVSRQTSIPPRCCLSRDPMGVSCRGAACGSSRANDRRVRSLIQYVSP
jgi:hypothetical protein